MEIENTVEKFLSSNKPDLSSIRKYHLAHPKIFNTYFNGYCKKTTEKMKAAIYRYSEDYSRLQEIAKLLPGVIKNVAGKGKDYFGFSLDVPVHIFVGLYASNAFVDHKTEIYFAVEKLHQDPKLLEVIVAHEFVHSYHYHILGRAGIDWNAINWLDVRISMYLEGIATYFSEKLVPGNPKSVYFSYDEKGEDWFSFCQENYMKLVEAFKDELENGSVNMEQEWFRLSGGKQFGYSRLGYYLGTSFVRDLCKRLTASEALTLLANGDITNSVDNWFKAQLLNKG
ncbi:hypothetical protein GCM10011409_09830 [Lentibacillus populi]|uniref:DUF2268 domain-containing protein n=2 Tax=Bacillaceae TaxID=186817 RepID=A0A9W5TVB1_9BACI|nr:aminopeptidase [Lentibacillus populi]GGB34387.1 hypothetical protein GCM10011409_09830 [Lentibacillus populi]